MLPSVYGFHRTSCPQPSSHLSALEHFKIHRSKLEKFHESQKIGLKVIKGEG
jgi:hypothetical protein